MDFFTHAAVQERLIVLAIALCAAWALGGPLTLYRSLGLHKPSRALRKRIHKLERKLNRSNRSAGKLVYRGIILFLVLTALAAAFAASIIALRHVWAYGIYVEMAVVAYLLPMRYAFGRTGLVHKALEKNKPANVRKTLFAMARRDTSNMDEHAMVRVSTEYLAVQFASKLVAAMFWYAVGGILALCITRIWYVLADIIGYNSKRLIAFGWAARQMDYVAQWVPARLASLSIITAALFVPRCSFTKSIKAIWRDAGKLASSNRGWPIASMAGALHITLGGPRKLDNHLIQDGWIGEGTAKATPRHLYRARLLFLCCNLLVLIELAGILMWLRQ